MRRLFLLLSLLLGVVVTAAGIASADDDVHHYEIEMYNAFGLVQGSDVRVAGVNVGVIKDVGINADKRAVVSVELAGDLARLGDETTCETSPQSLIAEYFIDCRPAGDPLPDGGSIPADRVGQTVQPDLVANTMREPFRERLTLIVNEFGTALAGNPEALNEAIRLGSPALTELEQVTGILAGQANTIKRLNVRSERVSEELARYKEQIVRFIDEAEDLSSTSLERRESVSRGFDLFDDYVAELGPTLAQLDETADKQAPLLAALRTAAPELHRLSVSLPAFQRVSERSLDSLGSAAVVGEGALVEGREEIESLAEAGRHAPVTTEMLGDLLRDLDDPRRAVEINDLAERTTGRTGTEPGTSDTKGYTGFEGLLNYPYYQALAINQFDRVGTTLHINLYDVFSGACGGFSSGRDPETGEPGVPTDDGGTTTEFSELPLCSTWLGPNQPGISEDLGLAKYDPSVCPDGTGPEHARLTLCDPGGEPEEVRDSKLPDRPGPKSAGEGEQPGPKPEPGAKAPPGAAPGLPPLPPVEGLDGVLDEIEGLLNQPAKPLAPLGGRKALGSRSAATRDLLDFLFRP